MQAAALIAGVSLDINRMPEQGPSVSGVPFHIGTGIEKIPQEREVLELNRIMSRPPHHGIGSLISASANSRQQCTRPAVAFYTLAPRLKNFHLRPC
jgi:hypothetical protein